ncbi:anti-sigma-F factor Fin [Compostibacillus humi]|uniref:Anti-sigma-F factor Fin n=1 Tax=Compostibacillus humi TaxID=1245525 RepID=A0A8J2TQD4_9BACI|nr:anti-sigma-F factor Fin family protein [Compostibacillus humi]GFZ82284.1 anti-sigma-F factor Fin [Compostibacillus humi]HLT54690.1 anti-sigma-F factor Fin family protein [Bacillota bacterium]
MAVIYHCRHCKHEIGRIEQQVIDTEMLGFEQLSPKEKEEMIHYLDNGDIEVLTICENCEETLGRYPHYHELDFFIQ